MKRKLALLCCMSAASFLAGVIAVIECGKHGSNPFISTSADSSYSLKLNASNKYNGLATVNQFTSSGAATVGFSYSNASVSSNGHVVLNDGGNLKNTEQITSVTSFSATFNSEEDATLKFRASFDGKQWGNYATMKSGGSYTLPSVYFIELTAEGGSVDILSVQYNYTCSENTDISTSSGGTSFEKVTSGTTFAGTYLIVYEQTTSKANSYIALDGSLTSIDTEGNHISVSASNNKITYSDTLLASSFTIAAVTGGYSIQSNAGYYIGDGSRNGISSSKSTAYVNTISLSSGNAIITGSNSRQLQFNNSSNNGNRFRYYNADTQKPICLYKLNGNAVPTPIYETGISVSDENKSTYLVSDKFDSFVLNGGLSVKKTMSNSTSVDLTKSDFTYEVTDSNNVKVDTSKSFGTEGTYIVKVSYKDFAEQVYQITVSKPSTATTYYSVSSTNLPTSYTSKTITVDSISYTISNVACFSTGTMQFKKQGSYIYNSTAISTITKIELETVGSSTFNGTLYVGSKENPTSGTSIDVTNGNAYEITGGATYFRLENPKSSAGYLKSIKVYYSSTPIDPTAISIPVTLELGVGKKSTLTPTFTPSNANQNKGVSWNSNNNNVATVDSNGIVTGVSTGNATITVTSTFNSSINASCNVTVTESSKSAWTILIYMCGSDLESEYARSNEGLATSDLSEILSVSNQPDDVNIVIQTGGSKSWSSTYSISSSKLQRWHVSNKKLVKDAELSKANMGKSETLQSFIEYGLTNFDAEKVGLVLWNHGGGMHGVCYDENYSNDCLYNSEVSTALKNSFTTMSRTEKLEFIGYDACLMQVQDVAEFNSKYFNYMIASQESESGYGWDYDSWVDDLYAKKSTEVILKEICDSFITDNGGTSSKTNDQTLSFLKLDAMSNYKTAFENLATALSSKITSSNKSSFNSLMQSCKDYGDDTDEEGYEYFCEFDAKDFINKLSSSSTFNPGSTYTSAVLTAFNNLVGYSTCGKGAGNSNGLSLFWSSKYNKSYSSYISEAYDTNETNFTNWRTLMTTYGYLS